MIYFVRAGSHPGPMKVGYTQSRSRLYNRLRELQTGNHLPLTLIGTTPGAHVTERKLHALLSEQRMSGEWFDARTGAARRLADAVEKRAFNVDEWVARETDAAALAAIPKPKRPSAQTLKRRSRKASFQRAVDEGMVFRPLTQPGLCVSCDDPRPVLTAGPEAGCHVAESACEHCGHVEPA